MGKTKKRKLDEPIQLSLVFEEIEAAQEKFWLKLTPDEQLDAFCCVVRRLVKAELKEGQTYRGTLYDTFNFGIRSYGTAQLAGFLELHNSIYTRNAFKEMLIKILEDLEIDIDPVVLNEALSLNGISH